MDKDTLTKKQLKRLTHRASQYGISVDDLFQLIEKQNGCCPICDNELELFGTGKSAVDHCHTTNTIRGIICLQCNIWIGMYEKRGIKLSNMIQYLRNNDNLIIPSTPIYDRNNRIVGKPGRPKTGKAKSSAERQAAYRARKKSLHD